MAAPKGKVMNPKGRGSAPNRSTVEFKDAVNNLINFATPKMVGWLEKIAVDSPDKALDHIYKFAQFGFPLLARTEVTGKDGGAVQYKEVPATAEEARAQYENLLKEK